MSSHYTLAQHLAWMWHYQPFTLGVYALCIVLLVDKAVFFAKMRRVNGWHFQFDLKTVLHWSLIAAGSGEAVHSYLQQANDLLEAICK